MSLPPPTTVVTDKGKGVFQAVPRVFPEAAHLLCAWHFNRGVLTWVKRFFTKEGRARNLYPRQVRDYAQRRRDDFEQLFKAVRWAKTEADFNSSYEALQAGYSDESYRPIFHYLQQTWFGKHKEKVIPAWTDKVLHFGNASSNRVEGMHAKIKRGIPASKPHLETLLDEIRRFLTRLNRAIIDHITKDRTVRQRRFKGRLYQDLHHNISYFAMAKVEGERQRVNLQYNNAQVLSLPDCTHAMSTNMGMPCQHVIQQRMRDNEPLRVTDFHKQWRLDRYSELRRPLGFELVTDPRDVRIKRSVPQTAEDALDQEIAEDIAVIEPIQRVNKRRKQTAQSTRKRRAQAATTQASQEEEERTFLNETNASEDELLDDLLASDLEEEDIEDLSDDEDDTQRTQQPGRTLSQLIDELQDDL